jgi:AcrR family transcriptional regulator
MSNPIPTRERIVTAGADLLRVKGYTGTGVKEIVTLAGAPFGSLYHHFPGGKEQLGEEVIRHSGALYGELVPLIFDAVPDVVTGVRAFFDGAAAHLRETDYADACPIATVALEVASTSEPLRQATADVFESWIVGLAPRFVATGLSEERARELAIAVLCGLEGAFVLARAMRETVALDVAGAVAADAVARALEEAAA